MPMDWNDGMVDAGDVWGVDKLHPSSSHMLIAHWLESYPPVTRILDVGTASGTIGRFCKDWSIFSLDQPSSSYLYPIWSGINSVQTAFVTDY